MVSATLDIVPKGGSDSDMATKIPFDKVHTVPKGTGIYEIHTISGIPLKVGISVNINARLKRHKSSLQSELKPKPGHNRSRPENVISKGSILAKHLFFDTAIAPEYKLNTQDGRRTFLLNQCYIRYEKTEDIAAAKLKENKRENSGRFRYVGDVIKR